ncbi:hypothetical protein MYA_2186 [Burkholderia sp. KJ006]|nr:hypothetical protein MYA_2186 [Burkholderia sp. KJ006]
MRTIVVRCVGGRDDPRDVAGEIADGDVDLGKSESGLHDGIGAAGRRALNG